MSQTIDEQMETIAKELRSVSYDDWTTNKCVAEFKSLIIDTLRSIELPEETDNHRLFLVIGDKGRDEEKVRLYAQLRQNGHNHALRACKQAIEAKIKEVSGE